MTQEDFKEEVQRLRPLLMLTARRYLGDDDAEDTVQDALLRLWQMVGELRQPLDALALRMTGDTRFVKAPDGNVALENYPLQVSPDFSRIKVFSLTANLGYTHEFDEDFWIGFGPVVNFNVYGSMLTEYSMHGDDIERLERHIRQRPITIDWMLRVGIMGVPLYLKYSGDNVLKDGGVKFRSLSFGLYL